MLAIAYRLNPTVDSTYAKTLKTAYVPSTTNAFFDSISNAFSWVLPARADTSPQANFARLPSNVELEDHDFSREQLAEKRLYLLNDNGQLDWYLNTARTLDNQYLNMIGAHSCYWENRDFARMLVVEAGRAMGRNGTIKSMRVQKKRGLSVPK